MTAVASGPNIRRFRTRGPLELVLTLAPLRHGRPDPTIRFVGRRVEKLGKDRYRLTGDLTIRGVTREVPLEVELQGTVKDPWGNERAGYRASGVINRHDFGLNWNAALETGGVVVGAEVKITLEGELIRQAQKAAA